MTENKGSLSSDFFPGPVLIDYNEAEAKMLDLIAAEDELMMQSGPIEDAGEADRHEPQKGDDHSSDEQEGDDLRWKAEPRETDGLLQRPGASRGPSLDFDDHNPIVMNAQLEVVQDIKRPLNYKERLQHYKDLRDRYTRPLKLQNLGIFASYFCVGVVSYFVNASTLVYAIYTLDVDSVLTTVLVACFQLPWSFKVFYGIFIDSNEIFGYHRKVWMTLGWSIHCLANFVLYMIGEPQIVTIIIFVFIMTNGMLLADVAHDTMNVERAKLESSSVKGYLQSRAYTLRGLGFTVGATLGAFALDDGSDSWSLGLTIGQVYLANAFIPICLCIPFFFHLVEISAGMSKITLYERFTAILEVLKLRAVWEPMTFVFLYNSCILTNPAWYNFEVLALGFDSFDLGLLNICTALSLFCGYSFYSAFLMDTSWRSIFLGATFLGVIFGLGQLVLENKWNKGVIPDIVFAMGDISAYHFCMAVQLIPVAIMYVSISPPGSEGSIYALLTTIANLGGSCALVISNAFVGIWDVSNSTLESGDWSGVLNLTILCNSVHFLPLVLIRMLPANKYDQVKLRESGERSETNGVLFGIIILCAFVITIGSNIIYIIDNDDDAR